MTSYTSGRSGRRASTARIKENVVFLCPSRWSASRSPKQNVTRNRNCASVGVNPPCRFKRLFRSFMQSCASGSPGRGHARMVAITRRASAPVATSNAPSRIVESCARHRVASGGAAACGELRHRTIRGTIPSRIARLCLDNPALGAEDPRRPRSSSSGSFSSPSFSSSPSSRRPPFPPTPFSPDILRSSARSRLSANTTRISKLGGTSSADPASAAMPEGSFPPSVCAWSSSSSPYFAFLYRSPAFGPASSATNGSEPGAGSLIRYLMRAFVCVFV